MKLEAIYDWTAGADPMGVAPVVSKRSRPRRPGTDPLVFKERAGPGLLGARDGEIDHVSGLG